MKYWRLKLKGDRAADEIQATLGWSSATLVRVHHEGGETHLYFAAEKAPAADVMKAAREAGPLESVSAAQITKLS